MRVTKGVLHSVSKGISLYLCIAHVDLEGSSRRKFLCTNVMNEIQILTLHDVDVNSVDLIDEHDIGLNCYV